MKIFTDEHGKEFEEVDVKDLSDIKPQDVLIRPIETKKWEVEIIGFDKSPKPGLFDGTIQTNLHATKAQAELIKDCVEAVMEGIFEPKSHASTLIGSVDKARKAINKE